MLRIKCYAIKNIGTMKKIPLQALAHRVSFKVNVQRIT